MTMADDLVEDDNRAFARDHLQLIAAQREAEFLQGLAGHLSAFGHDLEATARRFGVQGVTFDEAGPSPPSRPAGTSKRPNAMASRPPSLMPRERRHLLGLLATSIVMPTVDRMERLFPEYEWDKAVRHLASEGFVTTETDAIVGPDGTRHDAIRVLPEIKAAIEGDEDEERDLLEAWVAAYEVRRDHSDIGMLLGATYLRLSRLEDSVEVMVHVAEALDPGSDNDWYLNMLSQIIDLNGDKKLRPDLRVRLYNAYGLCLNRAGRRTEASEWFRRLRRYATRTGDVWGVGQSYLNAGANYAELGEPRRARSDYRKAETHARTHGDDVLLSRVLHNLAVLMAGNDSDEAHRLLNESVALKESADDVMGTVHVHLARGLVHALAGEQTEAQGAYSKAVQLARRHDLRHLLAVALVESGIAAREDKQADRGIGAFREAYAIAEVEGYGAVLHRARGQLAVTLAQSGGYEEAAGLFEQVIKVDQESGEPANVVSALHDWALCVLHLGEIERAQHLLDQALAHAREIGDTSWTERVQMARAFSVSAGEPSLEGAQRLRTLAREETERGQADVAAWLLDRRSRALVVLHAPSSEIEFSFQEAEAAFGALEDAASLVELYASWFTWHREATGLNQEGIVASFALLHRMQEAADAAGDPVALAQALDEEAVGLQHLERYDEAEPLHRRALRLSKSATDERDRAVSLTNLGELYRRSGRAAKAIPLYEEAIALSGGDKAALQTLRHNRALALETVGRPDEAQAELVATRRRAQALGAWGDHARASIALGDLAWATDDRPRAVGLYRQAYAVALDHEERIIALKAALAWGHALEGRRGAEAARSRIRDLAQNDLVAGLSPRERYELYRVLAGLAEVVDDMEDAAEQWAQAAAVASDREHSADAWFSLGAARLETGDPSGADAAFREALNCKDDPEERAALMFDRFRALAAAGDDESLEAIYDEARQWMEEHGFTSRLVDLHMAVGDHQWEGADYAEAVKAYAVAAVHAATFVTDESDDALTPVLFHTFDRLREIVWERQPGLGPPAVALASLRDETEVWFQSQVPTDDPLVVRLLLWPLRAAARLAALGRKRATAKATRQILMEEVGLDSSSAES